MRGSVFMAVAEEEDKEHPGLAPRAVRSTAAAIEDAYNTSCGLLLPSIPELACKTLHSTHRRVSAARKTREQNMGI